MTFTLNAKADSDLMNLSNKDCNKDCHSIVN